MNEELKELLYSKGMDEVRFVDISDLPADQSQGYTKAVIFYKALPKDFIIAVRDGEKTGYEFADMEHETDELADWLAGHLRVEMYRELPEDAGVCTRERLKTILRRLIWRAPVKMYYTATDYQSPD